MKSTDWTDNGKKGKKQPVGFTGWEKGGKES
jgi:hypothetical protein